MYSAGSRLDLSSTRKQWRAVYGRMYEHGGFMQSANKRKQIGQTKQINDSNNRRIATSCMVHRTIAFL